MLIRTNGGKSGIKEYLEKGQKHDRYFTRDDLDERYIINGDLEIVDKLISGIQSNGEKYFHITLAFKEDHIEPKILENISQEFRDFYFNAFSDNEIMYYSEAHLPRIKSYKDKDNNLIERKPHLHIVVPKINLQTGNIVDYKEADNIIYLDAFQEYINAKYGLESPKDNLRFKINGNSEYISRYTGDGFKGKGKDLKIELLNYILKNDINDIAQLAKYLGDSGYTITTRNSYKIPEKSYLNIAKNDQKYNLRDHVFTNEFLSLSHENKLKHLNQTNDNTSKSTKYIIPETGINVDEKHLNILSEWNHLKSLEIKYLKNYSKNQRKKYQDISYEDKIKYLDKIHKQNQSKVENINIKEHSNERGNTTREYNRIIDLYLESTRSNVEGLKDDVTRHCGIEGENLTRRWKHELERRYSANSKQSWGSERGYRNHQNSSDDGEFNPISNVTDNIDYLYNKTNFTSFELKSMAKTFNEEIRADVLLELLEITHGVNPELYRITKSYDGFDRIGAGNRNLSNLDFCVKEINLPLKSALHLLGLAYNMQLEIDRKYGFDNANGDYLIKEYKSWLNGYKTERSNILAENKDQNKILIDEIKLKYKAKIQEIKDDKTIFYHKKKDLIRATNFEKMVDIQKAYKFIKVENYETRQKYNLEMQQSYRIFLMRKAQERDERALRELRRLRIDYNMSVETLSISYAGRFSEYRLPITHEIDKDGVIHYKVKETTVIKDHGVRIEVAKRKDEYIELSLKLAMQKYGNKLSIRGKDEFRKECVEVALKNGYKIEYLDDFSKKYHAELVDKLRATENKIKNDTDSLMKDKPSKLIVNGTIPIQVLQYNKNQTLNSLELIDPDTNNKYLVSNQKLNFTANKFNVGDLVTVKMENNTNEIKVSLTPEYIVKAIVRNEVLTKLREEFNQENSLNHKKYIGVLVKVGVLKDVGWSLLKTPDGKFVKIVNDSIYQQVKNIKLGSEISVVASGAKETVQYTTKHVTTVTKMPSIKDEISKYKMSPGTIIGEILKQSGFDFSDGKKGYRILIRNIESGKKEAIFLDTKLDVTAGEFMQIDKSGWNNYTIKKINELRDTILSQYGKTDTSVKGEIVSTGRIEVRGKPVFYVELNTIDGTIKKYGAQIELQINQENLKKGDYIEVRNERHQVSGPRHEMVYLVNNFSELSEKLVDEQINKLNDVNNNIL